MKLYRVVKGTQAKLITQEPMKDCDIQDFVVRRDAMFSDHQVLGDPIRLSNDPSCLPEGSPIFRLVKQGYTIFTNSDGGGIENEKYFLAVLYDRVSVIC